jgi:MinD-like ATPase involved in chromosome partitioning or flagellar assembly
VTVRVATILSAREWEPALVAYANETATVRIVLRAFQPRDIESHASDIDVVVAGGEVTWVTPHQIATWRRLGLGVIGMHPPGDTPAVSLLELGGVDEALPDTTEVAALVQAIRFVAPNERSEADRHRGVVTAVVGTRGAPGCTEVAFGLATLKGGAGSTLLIDADLEAPSLAVRLGVAPRPDIADAADLVRGEGTIDASVVRSFGAIEVIPGSHRDGEAPMRAHMLSGLLEATASLYDEVVVDLGSARPSDELLETLDEVVLVIEASPIGIVRAARTTKNWFGPTPTLVLNKVDTRSRSEVVEAVRKWTGLDPEAVIPRRHRVHRSAISGRPPDRSVTRALVGVGS